jgi:phosphate transport system permease protein
MTLRNRWRKTLSIVMLSLTGVCAVLAVSVLFLILGYLVYNGWRSVDWNFFTKLPKPPGETGGGMANAILGSIQIVAIATVIGLPIGFLAGIYLSEFGGKSFASIVRYMADLLNGVPSIVIGIFAWSVVVVTTRHFSALAGGLGLSLILIPITARSTEQFLSTVPQSLREGALALGASKWKTIATVVVPAAYRGIATGMILGVARISGETAPLIFTSGDSQHWSSGWSQPTASLPVMIYTHAIAVYDDWHRQAWAAGLVLLLLVLFANIAARLILSRGIAVQK